MLQTMTPVSGRRRKRTEVNNDYSLFAAEHLRIRTKAGAITPLLFNRAQRFVHEKLEAQRAETGSLRTELRGMNERLDRIIEKFAQHA
jgi:uncharacterized membrane protein